MSFDDLMQRFAAAAVAGDGGTLAALFAEDGQYQDVFYGTFPGRSEIVDLLENHFHRDGTNFRWDMHDPVCQGDIGYVRSATIRSSRAPKDGAAFSKASPSSRCGTA